MALHLGSLHAYEAVLLAVLAVGPFVVLAVVLLVISRRDADSDESSSEPPAADG